MNSHNRYRQRRGDTRAGTIKLAIPNLRQGSYFPEWLLERRRRSEQALISMVATSYLLGVSTRRVEELAGTLGITSLSESQVSERAKSLDGAVERFRSRPLDAGSGSVPKSRRREFRLAHGALRIGCSSWPAGGVRLGGVWMLHPPAAGTRRGGVNKDAMPDRGCLRPVVVRLPAEIDIGNVGAVGAELGAALAAGVRVVIADMTATMFCDCSALRELDHAHRAAADRDITMCLAACSPAVRRVMSVTGLADGIPAYRSVRDALTASPAPASPWHADDGGLVG